jgi:hypothetical protein
MAKYLLKSVAPAPRIADLVAVLLRGSDGTAATPFRIEQFFEIAAARIE